MAVRQVNSFQPKQKSILLAKLGTLPELSTIVTELGELIPDARLLGIGVKDVIPSPHLEIVAHERQLILGTYDAWWDEQLFVDPDLYVKLLPKESQLLRTIERIVRYDVFEVETPSFPVEPFRDTYQGRSQLLLRQIAFWDSILIKQNVAAVVAQNIPHNFWDAVLYAVTKARDIPYLFFHETPPFMSSMYFYEQLEDMGDLRFSSQLIQKAKEKYGLIPDSPNRAEIMRAQVSVQSARRSRELGKRQKYSTPKRLLRLLRNPRHTPYKVLRSLNRRFADFRSRRRERHVSRIDVLPEKNFLIELHVQSNATTLMKGYMYGEQREMLAHIAHSLPAGHTLIVRESSRQSSRKQPRREAFWQQVAGLPRVQIIGDEIDSEQVLLGSTGLVDLGYSSLVLEAINLDIPVVVLRLTHLHSAPNVHIVADSRSLSEILVKLSQQPRENSDWREAVRLKLSRWADSVRESTLQASLSIPFKANLARDPDFQVRALKNVARVIATWYQTSVK